MVYDTISVEKEEAIAVVRLNRPPVNFLITKSYAELYDAFSELDVDETVSVIILTGAGDKCFTLGLDIKDAAGKTMAEYLDFSTTVRKAVDSIGNAKKPTIAALFGFALGGGCELALACDLRIAANDATIGCPEVNLGIMPGSGGSQRMTRLIGLSKTKELLLMGDTVTGEEAARIGLVNKAVAKEALMDEAKTWAKKLAKRPKVAVSLIKKAIDQGMNMDLASAISLESECFALSYVSEDGREGISAFAQKRKPVFKGR
jgi:enoyl-CoA hydratase